MQCLQFAAAATLVLVASVCSAAAPVKTLRYILPAAEASFDPALGRDYYTGHITEAIFETLYTYDYLARPVQLAPQTAAALPEVSADGKTYLIRLKKGTYFTPDPAFGGKPRELTVADYVYSWKRLFDPRLASPNAWLLEGKVVGLDALAAQAQKSGRFDYDAPVAGLEILDPYTLRIHLTHTDFNLGMILAYEPLSAVAREVVQKYGDSKGEVAGHPVGTGVYKLGEWIRGSRIVLEENTGHRPQVWDFQPSAEGDERIVQQMKGKKIPQIGRIEISVQVEDQSRWLSFISGGADVFWLEGALAPKALADGKLKPELAQRGVQLSRIVDPELSYYYWNMQDPVVGGFSKEKVALRRAIAMAHDVDEEIKLVLNGEAQRLHFPIPSGVAGHDPNYQPLLRYDPVLANQLLDRYGYKKGADGWRTQPDGKPLVITYTSRNEANGVLMAELWRKTYNRLGIRMDNQRMIFSDIQKAEMLCKVQSRTYQWLADYPDGDNFMQLFYGGNIGQNNNGCYQDAQYDAWFEASHRMPPGPQRDALYRKMARQLEVQAAVMPAFSRYRNMLAQPTVLGYKKHPILHQEWKYIDIKD
ncbi:heme-binding protein [Pseudoduganella sp. FT55W]|uniref:Heme-binding protein n=1 Tax=Duganella rivi TaxID=2666083 RepID=A0A7X4K948_9BURK|nr:ABC transporter substrate-binding protein [Duganella rivi]MYM65646.1 heme-binding protein [Duganella rivi]